MWNEEERGKETSNYSTICLFICFEELNISGSTYFLISYTLSVAFYLKRTAQKLRLLSSSPFVIIRNTL
jgi:hypothetical protein